MEENEWTIVEKKKKTPKTPKTLRTLKESQKQQNKMQKHHLLEGYSLFKKEEWTLTDEELLKCNNELKPRNIHWECSSSDEISEIIGRPFFPCLRCSFCCDLDDTIWFESVQIYRKGRDFLFMNY